MPWPKIQGPINLYIFNFKRKDAKMRRFIRNIFLFVLPLVLLSLIPTWFYCVGYRAGEFKDIDEAIKLQRENKTASLGMAYNEQTAYYKITNANYYQADVIALGTSRVMQIREEYFTASFYNCGGGVSTNYDEYLNFVLNLEYRPKIIILGLDCWVFNDNWNKSVRSYSQYTKITEQKRPLPGMLKSFITDWLNKKWTQDSLSNFPNNIGVNARVKNDGFRFDGSYRYWNRYLYPEAQSDYQFVNTINRINNGISRFEFGGEIDYETVEMLSEFLSYCEENNIYVIGFSAPLAPSIYDLMVNTGNYAYLDGIAPACEKIFSDHGYPFYNYLDGEVLGYDDESYVDGFHGGDIVYAEIMQRIAEDDDRIAACVEIETIRRLISESDNCLTFGE